MYQGKWTKKAVRKREKQNARNAETARSKRREARRRRNYTSAVLFTASLILVLYGCTQILGYLIDEKVSQKRNTQLSSLAVETVPRTTLPVSQSKIEQPELPTEKPVQEMMISQESQPTEPTIEVAPIRVDFQLLQNESEDIIGWLYIPDTPINYPVLRSKNNLDYIRTLPDKTPNDSGSLFLDYRNETDFLSGYSVIYGHNMKNDTMFGTLEEYKEQEYYDTHKVLYLITPGASYRIEPVAGVITYGTSDYYDIPVSSDKAKDMVENAISNSTFVTEERPKSNTYLLLSTCSYESDDARFILIGALTQIESS